MAPLFLALALVGPPPSEPSDRPAHALIGAGRVGNAGYGGLVGYRVRAPSGFAAGIDLESVYLTTAFVGGFAVPNALRIAGRVPLFFPMHQGPRLTMALTLAPGVRWTNSFAESPPERRSFAVTVDTGAFAYVHGERLTWMAGADIPVSIQVSPITDVDMVGGLIATGPVVPIGERLHWYATLEAGGVFGSGGDGAKFLVRGTTGIRAVFGMSARRWRALY